MDISKKTGRAVFIDMCSTKACKADFIKLHKAVRANRYQTYVFSPRKPFDGRHARFKFAYYGSPEKLIRALRTGHRFDNKKLIIYVARDHKQKASACTKDTRVEKLIRALDKLPHVRGGKIRFSYPNSKAFLFKRQLCSDPTQKDSSPPRKRQKSAEEVKAAKKAKAERLRRKQLERTHLSGWFSGGFSKGLVVRQGSSFTTAGAMASAHVSLNKGVWLSGNANYMLSTGIEIGLDPILAYWEQGWYSVGGNLSLRLNLSKMSEAGDERWRIFIGPGFALNYAPELKKRRFARGISVNVGALFERYDSSLRSAMFMIGPELRIMHFPDKKETVYMLGIKFAWQRKQGDL
jgi:hypothetical protein